MKDTTAPHRTTPSERFGRRRSPLLSSRTLPFHLMLLPAVVLAFLFSYLPITGLVIAFQDFKPWHPLFQSPWVGLDHFRLLFEREDSVQVIWNTLIIAFQKILFGLAVPIVFALLLNEVRKIAFKRAVQTMVYLPHFLSWVILGSILIDLLSPEGGMVSRLLVSWFGMEPIFFLGDNRWFRFTLVVSEVWKEFGFSTILFLASLAGINPSLYEAAEVDGAGRWKMTLHITLPSLVPITVVCAVLSLSNILNAGFDQIFNLYNPMVYQTGDIIDTFVYRVGILDGKMSFATAVGLFKSVISCVLVVAVYRLAYKIANYRVF